MKKLRVFLVTSLLSISAFSIDITMSPVYTAVGLVESVLATGLASIAAPFVATTGSIASLQEQDQEQVQYVRDDALDFIANDGEYAPSELLAATFVKIREAGADAGNKDVEEASDLELAATIVYVVK